jgi:hypothetical protein
MAKLQPTKPWRNSWRVPQFYELVLTFPVFSDYKIVTTITKDLSETSRYIADRDYLKDHNGSDTADAFTATFPLKSLSRIYLLPDPDMGTVAHEAYHAVRALLERFGCKDDEEVIAYHLGYIVDQIAAFNLSVRSKFKKGKKS